MTIAMSGCARCGRAETVGQPCGCCPTCGGVKSASAMRCYKCTWPDRGPRTGVRYAAPEVALPEVVTHRRRPVRYRVYCFACGRSSEVETAPRQMSRCEACGGTMLVEMGDND